MASRPAGMTPLFAIPRVGPLSDVGRVVTDNSSDATYAVDSGGGRWVRKMYVNTGYQPVIAEALGWLIGREIGICVPDAAVHGSGDDLSWLSSYIPHAQHWDGSKAHFIVNINELGAALTLDAVLHNHDRHRQNILLVPEGDEC